LLRDVGVFPDEFLLVGDEVALGELGFEFSVEKLVNGSLEGFGLGIDILIKVDCLTA